MAVGKNKRLSKKGKGAKKKVVDPYTKKEWYDIKAPNIFDVRQAGKTLVTRTTGLRIASEALKGRVFELSLGDLNKDQDQGFRKIKLRCEDVQGRNLLTNFYGMDFTTDKLRSLVRKWQTLIEAHTDVKTADGYILRVFAIAFTKKRPDTTKKTCYAQTAQVKAIRKKIVEIITKEATSVELKALVKKFVTESIGREIEKTCSVIYPLQNVFIRKVKIIRSPKFDVSKLLELHNESAQDTGVKVERTEEPAAETTA